MLIVIVSVCCSDVYELCRIIRTAILWTWCCDKGNVENVYLNMIFLHYNNMSFLYIYDNLCVSDVYMCVTVYFSLFHTCAHTLSERE